MRSFDRPAPPRQGGRAARRARRNEAVRRIYAGCSEIAGPLDFSPEPWVEFRPVATPSQRLTLTFLASLNALTGLVFVGWLLMPAHVPGPGVPGIGGWQLAVARVSFCVVVAVELIRLVQNFAVWVFASKAADPVPKAPQAGLRVAMLTTIVPAREPLNVAERTLRAMLAVRYRGRVDVWILDEGNDPRVKEMARRLGVLYFTRKGIPEFNQPSGQFRAKTKAGNHNAWRYQFERYYDVVAQMDPDHAPLPCFLKRTLGYFRDPDVAFVVAPQVYGNMYDNWVAHGASVQQYLFSGVVERGGNGLDAPLLIGTNHLYRPSAWREIGGYQDAMVEDHMTGMRVQGTVNPKTGDNWLGVYTPDVLAIGEGPASWTDYFNQQKRWAYGIWEILLRPKLKAGIRLQRHQRLLYGLVQFYYPSVGATTLLGTLATAIYLLLGITAISMNGGQWLALWSASMASWLILWLWLRRFNLAEHERREIGVLGMVLALFAGPVYVAAGVTALLRRPLAYAVTAKGSLRSPDSFRTFRLHVLWAAASLALLAASFRFHHDYAALRAWASLAVIAGLGPPVIALTGRLTPGGSGGGRASGHPGGRKVAAEPATMGKLHPSARVPSPRQAVRRARTPMPHQPARGAEPSAVGGLRMLEHLSASQQAVREERARAAHSPKRSLAVSGLPQPRQHRQRAEENWDRHYETRAR
jgi:cellulose synthase (UDP-forming)